MLDLVADWDSKQFDSVGGKVGMAACYRNMAEYHNTVAADQFQCLIGIDTDHNCFD